METQWEEVDRIEKEEPSNYYMGQYDVHWPTKYDAIVRLKGIIFTVDVYALRLCGMSANLR